MGRESMVIDENVVSFFAEDKGDSVTFMKRFIITRSIFCLSKKLYYKYQRRLDSVERDYHNPNFLKAMRKFIVEEDRTLYCSDDICSDDAEKNPDFSEINLKDRHLLPIARHFNVPIVSEDEPLRNEVTKSLNCGVSCLSPQEGLVILNS